MQVLAAVDEVAEQLQACGAAKTTAMQDYAIKCYTQILTPLQSAKGHLEAQPFIMDTVALAAHLGALRLLPPVTESLAGLEPRHTFSGASELAWTHCGAAASQAHSVRASVEAAHRKVSRLKGPSPLRNTSQELITNMSGHVHFLPATRVSVAASDQAPSSVLTCSDIFGTERRAELHTGVEQRLCSAPGLHVIDLSR